MKHGWVLLGLSAVMLWTATAAAEDLQPPWWRGEYSTTSQVWEFNGTSGILPAPGVAIPPDGPAPGGMPPLPSTHLVWTPGPAPWDQWLATDMPYEYEPGKMVGVGVVPLSGQLNVVVDNHDPKPENIKLIWVQVTWRPQDFGEVPILMDLYPTPPDGPRIVEELILGDLGDPLAWRETTYQWQLPWNPPDEMFTIGGTINVDELVIDTWCIPEPASLSLLGIGVMAAIRRRR